MRIIPAIDLIEGKCVRLQQGDYTQKKIYNENPLEVAKSFVEAGIKYLHLVDLDGAKQKKPVNLSVLEKIATQTNLQIDFGGGIYTKDAVREVFEAGASQITAGSMVLKNPALFEEILGAYGSEKIILGADTKNRKIAIGAWEETTEIDILDFLSKYYHKGVKYAVCTDISKDGLLAGTAWELYQEILKKVPDLQLIASGGVSSLEDLKILQKVGVEAVIVGKAIYEGKITLKEIANLG
ncbi:MAG: 1-(5-phosphoribosyl)-5-[(5-phosphoribosylamino)methylideneamino]imidazole-4-carboxamide isomerase [Thermonemataceae bacterium]|nr:1-(5-phosphoribosyl)-5-[(5-phosphoribosylamino)methylideneamino]imidazole-4-carboxamide isomerase [Thermonemataceae bacterium]